MITAAQSKAARGLLDWSQARLAEESELSESTIRDFEKGRRSPSTQAMLAIVEAFASKGVTLIGNRRSSANGGVGVRFTEGIESADLESQRDHISMVINEVERQLLLIKQESEKSVNERNYDRMIALGEVSTYLEGLLDLKHEEFNDVNNYIEGLVRRRGEPK